MNPLDHDGRTAARTNRGAWVGAAAALAAALLLASCKPPPAPPPARPTPEQEELAFLDEVQKSAFDYFLHECGANGLVQDRMTNKKVYSALAGGYHLTALCVAAERGWIGREEAARRALETLKTLAGLKRFHGMFAHYYDIETGEVVSWMHPEDDGADVSETGFLMGGVLSCASYFDRDDSAENEIRKLADRLYREVEWDWMLQDGQGRTNRTLSWHWSPRHGFKIGQRVRSNMELSSMLTYLLAMGSPTHPIPPECWEQGWVREYRWEKVRGVRMVACPPLFAHQYAQSWIDFRNMKDRNADYFRNSLYASLAQKDYCTTELYPGTKLWGLTFCDGPKGYGLYGYPPPAGKVLEEATIAVTAPAASMPFTPRESIEALREMNARFRNKLWGKYGFYDSFSPKHDWFDQDYIGLDQGPIVVMMENHRSGLIWRRFMKLECVRRGLDRAGLVGVIDDFEPAGPAAPYSKWEAGNGVRLEVSEEGAIEGARCLKVKRSGTGGSPASWTATPAVPVFERYALLSLRVKGSRGPSVELETGEGRRMPLTPAGETTDATGWRLAYFELPAPDAQGRPTKVRFILPDGEPGCLLDQICLTNNKRIDPPAPVKQFAVAAGSGPGEVFLKWSALPAVGREADRRYLIGYSTAPIAGESDFDRARSVATDIKPFIFGDENSLRLGALEPGQTYYFAIRAQNDAGLVSPVTAAEAVRTSSGPVSPAVEDFEGPALETPSAAWSSTSMALSISAEKARHGRQALKVSFDKKGDKDRWNFVEADLGSRSLAEYKYLSVWVYGKTEILAKLWDTEERQQDISIQKATQKDGWTRLIFDYSPLTQVDKTLVRKILFFVQPGRTDCYGTVYLDSIELLKTKPESEGSQP